MAAVRAIYSLFKNTYDGWSRTSGPLLAAALSYYAVFSIAPLLILTVSVAGFFLGAELVSSILLQAVEDILTPDIARVFQAILENSPEMGSGATLTTLISLGVLVVGASLVFVQLKRAINILWGLPPYPKSWIKSMVLTQLLSTALALSIGVLFLMMMVLGTLLVYFNQMVDILPPRIEAVLPQANLGLLFIGFMVIFALIFKLLPDARIAWRDVWLGAAFTAFMFTLGEFLIGFYLSTVTLSSYGLASSSVLILLWVYYSMQIVLFGAKFTQVYAEKHGRGVVAAQPPSQPEK